MDEQTSPIPTAQQTGERCTGCGKPMAADQRYCLSCGKRRGKARVEFEEYLAPAAGGSGSVPPLSPGQGEVRPLPPEPADGRPEREVTPLMAAVGLAGVAAILLLGVLIGRSGGGGSSAPAPIYASAGLPASTSPTTASTASATFTADWPEGQEGFTIELATLSKEGSDPATIESAKADLVSQGAPEVGALDSDQYGSLPPGNYVLYSGVYTTKPEAETALKALRANFPDAQVVRVSAQAGPGGAAKATGSGGGASDGSLTDGSTAGSKGAVKASKEDLEKLNDLSPEEYEEAQKKLPSTIDTPGKAPPKDNKAPGGGSGGDAVTIG